LFSEKFGVFFYLKKRSKNIVIIYCFQRREKERERETVMEFEKDGGYDQCRIINTHRIFME
jgi:hypothetical protein